VRIYSVELEVLHEGEVVQATRERLRVECAWCGAFQNNRFFGGRRSGRGRNTSVFTSEGSTRKFGCCYMCGEIYL